MLDLDICKQNSQESEEKWPLNTLKEKGSNHVIRKFINSAIYVEKPLSTANSSENTSVSQKYSTEDLEIQTINTKRCTCSLDQKTCPCHSNTFFSFIPEDSHRSTTRTSETKTKISQTSVSSPSSNNTEKETVMKNWIAKKEEEKRKKEMKEKMLLEAKMKEREALLEQERNSFKKWLMNKKKMEMEAKKKKQKELEEMQVKELEKEKRQLENQLSFQLWLKKKEEKELEKKIKQQVELITEFEKKEKQLRDNERAFKEWLRNSKDKQKPVPMNRGLESLCSSTSVTYINPKPWNPVP